ncbi:MAG: branched-chain amino acid ABC transporter permease [Salinisphaera sp.]|jgi:branched-chain amino acid transport system permease protein|nr:branched-chain amino acid ABC transporter permease [Salinisphaera sp.]
MTHLIAQILVDGFVISAIYALGAAGFTIIFGVSGVLNLAHGAHLVIAATVAWLALTQWGWGLVGSSLAGIVAALISSYLLFGGVIRPIERSRRIPPEEKEIFTLTATLLVGIIAQGLLSYFFGSNPITTSPLVNGVTEIIGVRVPTNELIIGAVAWVVLALLWLFVHQTRLGKALLAASMSPRGLALIGVELNQVHFIVWGLYGLLTGLSGVLLASFLGASADDIPGLTALAFTIVVLGGLGNILGSLGAAYIIGILGTATAYLVSSSITELPALFLLIAILLVRPQGLFGRQ